MFIDRHSPHGSLARMRSDSGPGGPAPTRFSAMMRNWYSLPSTSSPIVVLLSAIGSRVMRIQRGVRPDAALLLSTWYPMIGVPPSFSGGPHDKTHESLYTSRTVGAVGGPGSSGKMTSRSHTSVNLLDREWCNEPDQNIVVVVCHYKRVIRCSYAC